jgi:hypothetical protein
MSDLAGRPGLGLKQPRVMKDPARLAAVAQLPCIICGARPVEVHHCISGRYGQRKAPDSMTIPLCVECHRGPHGIHASKRAWEALHGPDTGLLDRVNAMLTG